MYTRKKDGGPQPEDWPREYRERHLHTDSFFAGLIQAAEMTIAKLESNLSYCPKDLTLPLAYHGWANKEEAQRDAEACLANLKGHCPAVEKEIARCKRNLNELASGKASMRSVRARGGFDRAQAAQEGQLRRALEQRRRLTEVIRKLEAVLRKARAKTFPGKGKAEDHLHADVSLPGGNGGTGGSRTGSGTPPTRVPPASNKPSSTGGWGTSRSGSGDHRS
jgi:hypothetical protein